MFKKNNFLFLFILILVLLPFGCLEKTTESDPDPTIECPEGYHPCDSEADTLTCCPDEVPATMTQTHAPWPGLADTPWPMFMHDPQHTGRSQYEGPLTGEIEWSLDPNSEIFSNPVIDPFGNYIISARHDLGGNQKLLSITPDGNINWEVNFGGHLDSSPLISVDNHIYVCYSEQNASKHIYLVKTDMTGNILWNYDLGYINTIRSGKFSPNISIDGYTIYISGADSSLYAINSNGTLNWKLKSPPHVYNGELTVSPNGETIYLGTNINNLVAVDTSGTVKWSIPFGSPNKTFKNGEQFFDTSISAPCLDTDGNIYFFSKTGVHSLSPEGYIRWESSMENFSLGYNNGVTIGPLGEIYIASTPKIAVFNYDGSLRWDKSYWNQNRLIIDQQGNSFFGIFASRDYTPDQSIINFLSFNSDGYIRFMTMLGSNSGIVDIDSPGSINSDNTLIVGSDGGLPNEIFKIK